MGLDLQFIPRSTLSDRESIVDTEPKDSYAAAFSTAFVSVIHLQPFPLCCGESETRIDSIVHGE